MIDPCKLLNPKTLLRCLMLGTAWLLLIPMMLSPVTWIDKPWLGKPLYWMSLAGVGLNNWSEKLR
jgi:hypothetical protein